MSQESKYYNLEKFSARWNKDEFAFAVLTLESLSHDKLVELVDQCGITFGKEPTTSVDDETLIGVLIDDVKKDELLESLKTL